MLEHVSRSRACLNIDQCWKDVWRILSLGSKYFVTYFARQANLHFLAESAGKKNWPRHKRHQSLCVAWHAKNFCEGYKILNKTGWNLF